MEEKQKTEYRSQPARDAQEMNYGSKSYWDYLETSAHEHYDYFMKKGDPVTANKMLTQSLGEALAGNNRD